jgi:hypothetical protein
MYCRTHRKVVNFHGESDAKSNKNKKNQALGKLQITRLKSQSSVLVGHQI